MSWLPVLVLVTIVDRNPVAPEAIRRELNEFVDDVRTALLNPLLQESYMRETHRRPRDFAWTERLRDEDFFRASFFTKFAGQGRVRWHYGVAHSILAGIETTFINEGRDWLRDEDRALTYMVDGPDDRQLNGLRSFDFRMIWQIVSSIIIVTGTAAGAFVVSCTCSSLPTLALVNIILDLTPTIGLGCRSGGYLIYVIISFTSLTIELVVWWSTSQDSVRSWIRRHSVEGPLMRTLSLRINRRDNNRWSRYINSGVQRKCRWFNEASICDFVDLFILKPFDIVSSTWLIYIMSVKILLQERARI